MYENAEYIIIYETMIRINVTIHIYNSINVNSVKI